MEKKFMVFYIDEDYGYYTTTVDAYDILEALKDFSNNYAYFNIVGIMEKK